MKTDQSYTRLTMDIEQAEYGAIWPETPEGKAFIAGRLNNSALSKEGALKENFWTRIIHGMKSFFAQG